MTPEPPTSSDGSSLPQRHRPSLGNLAKDTTEIDLWDFDDDMEIPDVETEPEEVKAPRSFSGDIPAPRGTPPEKAQTPENPSPSQANGGEEQIRMNVTRRPAKKADPGMDRRPTRYESEFEDLEGWQDAKDTPEIEDLPAEVLPEAITPATEEVVVERPKAAEKPAAVEPAPVPATASDDDEFSPAKRENAVPVSMRPHLHLSKIERIGLIALLVLLVGGGATIFLGSLKRLPTEAIKAESTDFPIKGERMTISAATSYWRAPIVDGPDADIFRRGTELLPVLELTASGGPALIRIFFRDQEGATIGDAMTRKIDGEGVVKIPATAGFDDPGMHAAYRTGESKPWTVQVWEITSGDVSSGKSEKLFEMNVSTDRR
jgi:hypothetical protein